MSDLKLGSQEQKFRKRKVIWKDYFQGFLVQFASVFVIFRFQFLIECIIDPKINVRTPVLFFLDRWYEHNCKLIDVSYSFGLACNFFQFGVVEPNFIVLWILVELFFVL